MRRFWLEETALRQQKRPCVIVARRRIQGKIEQDSEGFGWIRKDSEPEVPNKCYFYHGFSHMGSRIRRMHLNSL